MKRNLFAATISVLFLAACGSAKAPIHVDLAQTVGPEGGTLELVEQGLRLVIPPGALRERTPITVRRLDDAVLPPGGVPGTAFELSPDGLRFEEPVTLELTYRDSDLPGADRSWLRVVQLLDGGGMAATRRGADPTATAVADRPAVSARLRHFSRYALADLKLAQAVIKTVKKKVTDVDVLFVIDNSGSMESEQANLATNFPKLATKLDLAGFSYRVGVVSTDVGAGHYGLPSCETALGDGGKLQHAPQLAGCTPPKDPWIERIDGVANVPDVAAAFSCIAQLGIGGCGFEQPLEAARRALDPKLMVNPGFLRDDAALAVIYITDEDDCSAANPSLFDPSQQGLHSSLGPLSSFRCFEFGVTCDVNDRTVPGPRKDCRPTEKGMLRSVEGYAQQLSQLKPAGDLVVSVISGPRAPVAVELDQGNPRLAPSCVSSAGMATPPIRLAALVDAFGSRGAMHSICDEDFGPALDALGQLVVNQTQLSWCMPYNPVDTDPQTAALEGDCVVVASQAGPLPACSAGAAEPCYQLSPGATCATSSTTIELRNIAPADLGDEVYAVCLTL